MQLQAYKKPLLTAGAVLGAVCLGFALLPLLLPFLLAYLVSLILSVLWNFTFNRKYTFRSNADVKRCMLLVALFYVVFTPLSTWWTAALTGENPFTGAAASAEPLVNNYVVEIGTMLINFVTEFLYQKFVVYRGTIDTNEQAKKAGKRENP